MKSFPMRKFSRLSLPEKEVKVFRVDPDKLAQGEKSLGLHQALELLLQEQKQPAPAWPSLDYFKKMLRPKAERPQVEQELAQVAQELNRIYFDGRINIPPIRLSSRMTWAGGYYHSASRERRDWISISTHIRFPLSILLHELTHAFQYQTGLGQHHDQGFKELTKRMPCPPRRYDEAISTRCEEQISQALSIQPLLQKQPVYEQIKLL